MQENKRVIENLKHEKNEIFYQKEFEHHFIQSFLINQELEMALNEGYQEIERDPEYTYEELLQLEEQIGNVSKGLTPEEISRICREKVLTATNCSICLVTLNQGTIAAKLTPCKHYYHFECIKRWVELNKTCPLCLQELKV
jgi:Ring finger domain